MRLSKEPSLLEFLRNRTSVFNREPVVFQLPEERSPEDQLNYVFTNIGKMAIAFNKKFKYPPTLVIDSVDRIAKDDKVMFTTLIQRAKDMVNSGLLHIVLVSSEGHVIPMLDKQSERTRSARVFHIPDLSQQEAKELFMKRGLTETLAKKLSVLCDGRLILIIQAHDILTSFMYEFGSEDEQYEGVKAHFLDLVEADMLRSKLITGNKYYRVKLLILQSIEEKPVTKVEIMNGIVGKDGISRSDAEKAYRELLSGKYIIAGMHNMVYFQTTLHKTYWKETCMKK